MNVCKIDYNGEIIFIVKSNIDSIRISIDIIRKGTDSVLLQVVLNNSNYIFRFMDIKKAIFVANMLLEKGYNEISI